MKRILAILLAVLMVVPAMVFTTAAEETALPATGFIPFATEDNMPTQDADNAALEAKYWNGLKWNGYGKSDATIAYDNGSKAVYYTINGVADGGYGFACYTNAGAGKDISGATSICFDLYISDVNNINQDTALWKLELYGKNSSGTYKTEAINEVTLRALNGKALVSGWNHISIPLTQVVDNGAFTITALEKVSLYNRNADVGVAGKTTTFKLKNIYLLKENILELGSFTKSSTWKFDLNAGTSYGAGKAKFNGFNNTAADISDMTTVSFMIYIPNGWAADAANINWKLQLYTVEASEKDTNALALTKTLADWCGGTVRGNKWNYIEAPLSSFSEGATCNLTQFTGFRFFNNGTITPSAKGQTQLKEMRLTAAPIADKRGMLPTIMATDMANLSAEDKANTGNWHRGDDAAKPQWKNNGAATALSYDEASAGVGFTLTAPMAYQNGIGVNINYKAVPSTQKFCFDMYISDLTLANVERATWRIKLFYEVGDLSIEKPLAEIAAMAGITLVPGWNHFELPLTSFTNYQNADKAKSDGSENGLKDFTIWYNDKDAGDEVNATSGTLRFMFRDLYFAPADGVAAAAPVNPTLTNTFDMSYKVTADANVVAKPYTTIALGSDAPKAVAMDENGNFDFDGILAHRLSDTITTTTYALNKYGEVARKVTTYSIQQYCDDMLGSTDDAKLKALLSDALYYGAAVQRVRGYNTENLATSITNAAKMAGERTLDKGALENCGASPRKGSATAGGPEWKSATLVLSGEMNIRYTFTATSTEGLVVKVKKPDGNWITYETFQEGTDGTYYVEVPVNAAHFNEDFVAQFGANDSYTVTYSVNAYVARNYKRFNEKNGGSDMYKLVVAIYNYGVSAEAFAK